MEISRQNGLKECDAQLSRLPIPWKDVYIETSFGRTHIVETGNFDGEPLLVFHGGNATTAYNLLACDFLFKDFHIYAVDTIGHPGKSAERSLSAANYDYVLLLVIKNQCHFRTARLCGGWIINDD